MVVRSSSHMEWEGYHPTSPRYSDRDRCIPTGLGCRMQWSANRWPVVQGRAVGTHQCAGADGRDVRSASICEGKAEGSCSPQDGQHISPILCDQNGRHTVLQTDRSGTQNVGLVSPTTDNSLSITPPGFGEPGGRPGVQAGTNIGGMEASRGGVQQDLRSFGALRGGPICHETEPPTGQVCELETRPGSYDDQCLPHQLGGPRRICFSSLLPDRQMSTKGENRTKHSCTSSTPMEKSTMVPNGIGADDRTPPASTRSEGHTDGSQGSDTPIGRPEQAKACRMENLRQQHTSAGVSKETSELLLAGWSRGTNTAYQSGWKRWSG